MSNRPSEKENVPFTQPPSSPKKLLDAFQLSPRTPRSPQRSIKCSPRPPVSPRSSPNRSRGHLRSTLNLHPPSLLTKARSHRVSFAQRDSHHLYTTPLRALPSYSSRPPAFVAARSILKARTPERVVVPDLDVDEAATVPRLSKREMSPVPDDPLQCPTYLNSPVSTIVASVSVAPSPNRIDSDMMDVCGPLPMSLHDLAEAYTLLLARLRLQAMTVAPDGTVTDTEITPDLPLLQPIQKHHSELAIALARDVARALVKPISFAAPVPYQVSDVEEWSSDYSSDVYGSSSPPGSPSGPTQKRGLTAAEVKYARDLSLVSQSAIRVLAVVFHEPAVSSHFADDELVEMLKVLISIPNTMPLPTPNPRKTHTAALWALQMIRLPLSIMHSPGVVDSLFVALQMAVQGKLGREGKKGSTSEGLTAVQLLTCHYPSIFGPMLPILMSDLVKCLSSFMPLIRQRAALALGGIVQGLFDWEEEEEVSAADAKRTLDLSAVYETRKEISEALVDTFDLEKNAKNAMILKSIKDILGQFNPESATGTVRAGDTPHWAFSVLASLVTLVERNFFACEALHTSVVTCARIALNAKKAAIRSAGGLLWGCVVWAWKRYDAHDESRGESEESLLNEKIMAQVVVENIGFGVVASLVETKDRSKVVMARRLRRACRCVKNMVEERCPGAPELLGRLLSVEESPSTPTASMATDRRLVPTSLLTQQLAGTDLKALAIAVNSNVAQGVKPEEVRPLTMDERVSEWPQLFSTWKHFPGWLPTTDEGEPAMWIEDEQLALSDQEFNDGPVMFYAHAMQGLTAVPDELLDLGQLAPFLASAFTRIPAPGAGPLAFSLFWNQKFAARGPPEGGYPEILKPCLRGILNIEELIEGGISLGTDLGEETQPKDLPAPDNTVDANTGTTGDSTSDKSTEQTGTSSEEANTSIESVEMADATNRQTEASADEETVESSVEEIDELLDDSDIVEETIVYEPPTRPGSPSSLVPARASTPVPGPARSDVRPQAESQCIPDSQPETTETVAEDTRAGPVTASICESPRKRKSEDAGLPSKRPKGLFVADPEIESLPILRFPTRSRSSSPSSVVEESIFYSPEKFNVPPPAWSPTGIPQQLPAFPTAKPVSVSADESAEISLSEIIETAKDPADESAETSVDDSTNTSIDDLPDNDLNDLPDITMSLPTRKKRMTLVVEVPRVSEVLKRWSSDSVSRTTSVSAITPRKERSGMPERVRRTRSWSKLPELANLPPASESTPSRRPLKRRRSDRDSPGEQSIELGRSRKNSRSSVRSGDLTITPKQVLTADMFDGESPDDTPSLRRVKSMPLSAKKAVVGSVGRAASIANSKTPTKPTDDSLKNAASVAQVESDATVDAAETIATTPAATAASDTPGASTAEPVTRTASLEALMADAEALAELDVAELMRQEEMLAAMREQVARALALKRAGSVASDAA
ncbi:hypothetical protein FRC07_008788 [Ceratobasidium sp. 392]|nr:hypothetical protein FRC07_008788 [Ceratobasidium sp. 392]